LARQRVKNELALEFQRTHRVEDLAMNGVARISFDGGARLMPAYSRYDRELVFEEAEFFARRHGKATLELNRSSMLVSSQPQAVDRGCFKCGKPLGTLWFGVDAHLVCRRCARRTAR